MMGSLCMKDVYERTPYLHGGLTSVFPLSLYRGESSIGRRALYKTLLLIRILRSYTRANPRHKMDTKPNQRSVHHRILQNSVAHK